MSDRENPVPDDEIDIQPWPVIEIIGRAVSLATVARRGMLEVDDERDTFDLETDRFDLTTWSRTELQNWISDRELELLSAPVGDLDDDALAECDNALVSASAIAWALRGIEIDRLPVPQDTAIEEQVLAWAPQPWMKVRQLQSRVRLRSDQELADERERWELWYWRATDGEEDATALADVVQEIAGAGLIAVSEGDLVTDEGVRFRELDADARDDIAWLAGLRLRALNWTCGFGPTWEAAPLYLDD